MKDDCSMLKLQLKEKDELISQLQEELVSDNICPTSVFFARVFAINPTTIYFLILFINGYDPSDYQFCNPVVIRI